MMTRIKPPYSNLTEFFFDRVHSMEEAHFLTSVDESFSATYGQFGNMVCSGARELMRQGVTSGSRVLLHLTNGPEFLSAFFSILVIGAVPVLTNPTHTADELSDMSRRTDSRWWITVFPDKAVSVMPAPCVIAPEAFVRTVEESAIVDWPKADPEDIAYIIFSSGSTAQPKGCLISHRNVLEELYSMRRAYMLPDNCTHLCILPMYHASALFRNFLIPFSQGGRVVVAPSFNAGKFWTWLERHQIGFVQVVPAILQALLESPDSPSEEVRPCLRYIGCASAPLRTVIQERFENRFGIRVGQGYGQTEATCGICFNHPSYSERPFGSVGRAIDIATIRILDDNGIERPVGETGNIVVSGPLVMKGYLDEVDLTGRPIAGDTLWTGDIGYLDGQGFLFIEGRKSDMIARAGFKVSPKEVESALLLLDGVQEAVVFGVPQDFFGEDIIGYVRTDGAIDEAAIRKNLEGRLARYKIPSRIFRIDGGDYSDNEFKITRAVYRRRYLERRERFASKAGSTAAVRRTHPTKPRAFLWNDEVYLRPLMKADVCSDIYLDNIMDPGVQFYTYSGRFPQSEWLIEDYWASVRAPAHMVMAICDSATDQHVGNISLRVDWVARIGEFGRMIFLKYQGEKWSEAALRLLLAYSFDELKLKRVWGGGANPASVPSLIKLGFVVEGTLRCHHFLRGEWRDQFMVGMLDTDWEGLKKGIRPQAFVNMGGIYSPEILSRVATIVEKCFGLSETPGAEAGPDSILGWDSLGTVVLWNMLEDEFGIALTSSDMVAIRNVGDLAAMLSVKQLRY